MSSGNRRTVDASVFDASLHRQADLVEAAWLRLRHWPLGNSSMLPITGGSATTRSSLAFVGTATKATFRALNFATNREEWHARLLGGANTTPMPYIDGIATNIPT